MGVVTAPVKPVEVPALSRFFWGTARAEGTPSDTESISLQLAEAQLRIAAGQSRIWVALGIGERRRATGDSPEEGTAGSSSPSLTVACRLSPDAYPVGMFQIDERFDPAFGGRGYVYEARRLYVDPEHRGGRVALALLKRAARDLPEGEAMIVFTVAGDKLPRLYRRLGAQPLRTIQGLELGAARYLLCPTPPQEESVWVEPPSRSLSER